MSSDVRRLTSAVVQGDREALSVLYERHAEDLYTVAYRFVASREDARDVLHDVFLTLPNALEEYDPKRPLDPWLRAVTRNAALAWLRRERQRCEVSFTSSLVDVDSPEERILSSVALERMLAELPDKLRIVIVLKALYGHTHEEIGELLEIEPSTAKGRLYRARKMLFEARDRQEDRRHELG